MIQIFDDLLSDNDFLIMGSEVQKLKWSFDGYSHDPNSADAYTFLFSPLYDNHFFKNYLWNIIQKKIGDGYRIHRVYANGQTFGLEGGMHSDDEDLKHAGEDGYTLLIYTNNVRDYSKLGETYFYHANGEIEGVLPKPNRAVLFSHDLIHRGASPRRDFKGLRVTIAYKLYKTKTQNNLEN